MITTENTGYEHYLKGFCCEAIANTKNIISIFPTEDERDFESCGYRNLVLADATEEANQNDVNSFLFKLASSSDTIVMTLQKDSVDVVALNDDTYGTYYALGSITYYDDQVLYAGYVLEWSKVLALHGIGNYRLKIEITSYGDSSTNYSICYLLHQFSNSLADKTIRIESKMNGYMLKSKMNYKGLNLPDMIRVDGYFGDAEEEQETVSDIFSSLNGQNRVVEQRKVNVIDIYNFETEMLPKCIADKIRYYHFLANEVYMSDYNSYNYDYDLKRIQVYKEDAFEFDYPKRNRSIIIKGKLKEKVQDNQKTNYF